MYKSQELRWFSKIKYQEISAWFEKQDGTILAGEPRTDYYLPLPRKNTINIKLREGKVEVKQRTGRPKQFELTHSAKGILENWVKWSFNLDEKDQLSRFIIEEKKYDWIEVYKERKAIIISRGEDGRIKFQDLRNYPLFGCQVEYTRLLIKEQEWFTFCLEWFGEQYLELKPFLLSAILGGSRLKKEQSMGYNQFLNSFFF